ncbi:MAG: SURF1 family cytochrome oxidase biogenesis protein [Actinomycetota bacterium]
MTGIAWSKRLVQLLAVALLVTTTCVALGIWQMARLHQKQQLNAAIRAGLSAPTAPIETLLSDGVDANAVRYHRAEATGTYDTAHEFVLYGRTQSSRAGNHMLTPLRLADGRAILVDRGWVPLDIDEPGAVAVAPPPGDVHVEGVLFSSDGDPPGVLGRAYGGETTLSRVDLARIQLQLPYRIVADYLLLQRQSPARSYRFPEPAPLPELSDGPHLGYAVQWFTFAAIAIAGFVVLALRERRDPDPADDDREG